MRQWITRETGKPFPLMRCLLWLGSLVLVLAASGASARDYSWQPLVQTITAAMKRDGVTGLSIVIVNDQQTLFSQGFGMADAERKWRADAETVYAAGTLAQPLTTLAVLRLHEQGKLDIDSPLATALPQFAIKSRFSAADPITPRNILSHHAGLPSYWLKGQWGRPAVSFTAFADLLHDEYTTAPPNEVYTYSEVGYGLLGHAIQQVSGRGFNEYMQDEVFRPLEMTHSTFTTRPAQARLAQGYRDGHPVEEPYFGNLPATGLFTSAGDIGRMMEVLFAGGRVGDGYLLHPTTVAEMMRPQHANLPLDADLRTALGWQVGSVKPAIDYDGPAVMCRGETLLMHGQIIMLPQEKIGVVVLANTESSSGTVYDLAIEGVRAALETRTGKCWYATPVPAPGPVISLSREEMQALTGQYSLMGALMTVKHRYGRLSLTVGDKTLEMVPRVGGRFTLQARIFGVFTFTVDALRDTSLSFATLAGRHVVIAEQRGKRSVVAVKLSPVVIPDSWRQRCGNYEITNPDRDTFVRTSDLRVLERDGVLLVHVRATPGGEVNVPLIPVNDTEAVTAGYGRGMGETIRVVRENGQEYLRFSGFIFRRR